jgi:hypothetical protein
MTAAAMHEEHRDRAGEKEKQKDESRGAHGVPPFHCLSQASTAAVKGV